LIKKLYEEDFGKADYPQFWNAPRIQTLIKCFSMGKFRVILDVGCGDGSVTLKLKQACSAIEVYGIDISETATKLAQEKDIKALCLNIDEQEFPFQDDFFDAICASEVFEHLIDPDRLLQNCMRVLKPGAFLILSSPNLASWYNRIALLLGYQPFYTGISLKHNVGHLRYHGQIGHDHLRVATSRALSELVKANGFQIRNAFTVPAGGEPFTIRVVSKILLSVFRDTGTTTFIIAQK
jgi:ubiquinone/menaquinone biosynthesis C-methylase UbiE